MTQKFSVTASSWKSNLALFITSIATVQPEHKFNLTTSSFATRWDIENETEMYT